MGPIGPKRAHFEFSQFWSFFSQVLKEKETSGKNPARQRRQECDHVNAVISGDFPKIAQNSPKRTKTDQNGPKRSISGNSHFDVGISPAICGMVRKRNYFEILTQKIFCEGISQGAEISPYTLVCQALVSGSSIVQASCSKGSVWMSARNNSIHT